MHEVAMLAHTPSIILGGDNQTLASTAVANPVASIVSRPLPGEVVVLSVAVSSACTFQPLSLSIMPLRRMQ